MIGYITLGTKQLMLAIDFYDELMALMGERRLWSSEDMAAWGADIHSPAFCISKPFNGEPCSVGNGVMIALRVESREIVQQVHAKAIALGGTCEGAPGTRGNSGFYGAYFRDLDGNKLNAYVPAPRP